jgi:hypothetical protein
MFNSVALSRSGEETCKPYHKGFYTCYRDLSKRGRIRLSPRVNIDQVDQVVGSTKRPGGNRRLIITWPREQLQPRYGDRQRLLTDSFAPSDQMCRVLRQNTASVHGQTSPPDSSRQRRTSGLPCPAAGVWQRNRSHARLPGGRAALGGSWPIRERVEQTGQLIISSSGNKRQTCGEHSDPEGH